MKSCTKQLKIGGELGTNIFWFWVFLIVLFCFTSFVHVCVHVRVCVNKTLYMERNSGASLNWALHKHSSWCKPILLSLLLTKPQFTMSGNKRFSFIFSMVAASFVYLKKGHKNVTLTFWQWLSYSNWMQIRLSAKCKWSLLVTNVLSSADMILLSFMPVWLYRFLCTYSHCMLGESCLVCLAGKYLHVNDLEY